MTEWLTVAEYAEAYAVSRPTVYKWLDAGLLTFFQVQRTIRVKHVPPAVNPSQSGQVTPSPVTLSRAK